MGQRGPIGQVHLGQRVDEMCVRAAAQMVFHQGQAYPDAQPLDLRQPRHRDLGQAAQVSVPQTGPNLLELAKRQYDEEQRKRLGAMRFPRPAKEDEEP